VTDGTLRMSRITEVAEHARNASREPNIVLLTSVVAIAVSFARAVSGWHLRVEETLAVPFGVVFGVPGAVGFALGNAILEVATAGLGTGSVVRFGSDLLLAWGAYVLWGTRPVPDVRNGIRRIRENQTGSVITTSARALATHVLVGTAALLCAVAVQALGLLVVGQRSFAVSVIVGLSERAVPAVLLSPVVLVALSALGKRGRGTERVRPVGPVRVLGVVLAVAGWMAVGLALSAGRQDVLTVFFSFDPVVGALPSALEPAVRFVLGPGYYPTQAAVASAFLAVVLLLVFPAERTDP